MRCSGTEVRHLASVYATIFSSRPASLASFKGILTAGQPNGFTTVELLSKPASYSLNSGSTSISVSRRVADRPQLRRNVSVANLDRSSVHLHTRSYCKYRKGGSRLAFSPSHLSYTLLCRLRSLFFSFLNAYRR